MPLKELLIEEMQDILHAENQLVKALPKMAKAADNSELKQAFEDHLKQTEGHVDRLKQAFDLLGEKAKAKPCKAMEGLIAEGTERIQEGKDKEESIADLALINAAQKVEHYEMAGYGNLHTIAQQLGENEVANLFASTLKEEEAADELLTKVSQPIMENALSEAESKDGEGEEATHTKSAAKHHKASR